MKLITKISILNGLILLFLTLLEFFGIVKFNLILSFQAHKMLHVFGVIIFMGNMIVGPVWFLFAYYSKDINLLKFANRLLQLTDLYLTIPGVFLTVINGLFLASIYGGTMNQPWLFNTIILLLIMWVLSIPLIYLQEKMYSLLEKNPESEKLNSLLMSWGILGTIVMIPPSVIFYLMIFKTF